jgi:hypothetical protein
MTMRNSDDLRNLVKSVRDCYGSGYVQTTRAWRNTYIGRESREREFLTLTSFKR